MRRFEHEELYMCYACNQAGRKEEFLPVLTADTEGARRQICICPSCGVLIDPSVANVTIEIDQKPTGKSKKE